jgi:hypothetical protein
MNLFRHRKATVFASAICSAFVLHSASAAELLDRAVLPANTFSPGPTSGQFATPAAGHQ